MKKQGFTLIELIVVVALIALIAAIAVLGVSELFAGDKATQSEAVQSGQRVTPAPVGGENYDWNAEHKAFVSKLIAKLENGELSEPADVKAEWSSYVNRWSDDPEAGHLVQRVSDSEVKDEFLASLKRIHSRL